MVYLFVYYYLFGNVVGVLDYVELIGGVKCE